MKFIKKTLNNISKISTINKKFLKTLLHDYIILVDVGSTGGIDEKWNQIEKHLHVITFDPDPRSNTPSTQGKFENYKIGLWSKKDEKELYLTSYPQASSFFNLNEKVLSSFLNYPCHKYIKEISFQVDKMENVLPKDIFPDFIKTDAEGSDLEILKGSTKYLSESCLGIQCEVSFINRHENAPYFSQIDHFLRLYNFILMDLETEKWIRKNNIFNCSSKPQIIWANAIYILSIDAFVKKIKNLSIENRIEKISKFISILLIHRFFDYAFELCEVLSSNNIISKDNYANFEKLIKGSIPSNFKCYVKCLSSLNISILLLISCSFLPNKRKKALSFFKKNIKDFGKILANTRHGPFESCV